MKQPPATVECRPNYEGLEILLALLFFFLLIWDLWTWPVSGEDKTEG